jgi:hypothetical protein
MTIESNKIPIKVFQIRKPKDGKDYTWRRVRRGEWERVSGGMPEGIFPSEATVEVRNHEEALIYSGSQAAHTAKKYDD